MPKSAAHLAKHKFKKGVSGNPAGGRAHNPITRALKNLTVETYRAVIEKVLTGNLDSLRSMIEDPEMSALQVGVARAFIKAIQAGDYGVIERIAERIVGKIPDELNVNANNANVNVNANLNFDPVRLRAALQKLESDV